MTTLTLDMIEREMRRLKAMMPRPPPRRLLCSAHMKGGADEVILIDFDKLGLTLGPAGRPDWDGMINPRALLRLSRVLRVSRLNRLRRVWKRHGAALYEIVPR